MEIKRIQKPWGFEVIFAITEQYVGKILHIEKGEALSLQYHQKKDETIYIKDGKIKFSWAKSPEAPLNIEILSEGQNFHIAPGVVHRMEALETTNIVEVSTPELDDVVRIDDRYGRVAGKVVGKVK